MPDIPFFPVLEATLSANSVATLSYTIPTNEKLLIYGLWFQSGGTFNVYGIRNSGGLNFTNASQSTEIPGSFFQDFDTSNIGLTEFRVPIELPGGTTFYLDIEDSSGGSNTVTFILDCVRTIP